MRKRTPKRSLKAGLPPGTLVHLGDQKVAELQIAIWQYDEHELREVELSELNQCVRAAAPDTVTWVNVIGLHQVEVMQQIGECFKLHPLVLEDVVDTSQRPKLEDYGDYLFIVMRALYPDGDATGPVSEQVAMILGPTYVISFEERASGLFGPVRERVRNGKGRTRKAGADFLLYSLMDAVVDNYFGVVEKLGDKLEDAEESIITDPDPADVRAIHDLKVDMMYLRKAIWPLREVIGGLQRADSELVKDATVTYLRDIYDHAIDVMDTIETYRDMLSGMLDIYLSSLSNRMNEIMKMLTIIATIFIPLTFIVGLYGMNFRYFPELGWRWGYPLVWLIMALTAGGMVLYFRKRKWL